jgi:hypothetical protein
VRFDPTGLVSAWAFDEASGTRVDAHDSNDLSDPVSVGRSVGPGSVGYSAVLVAAETDYLTVTSNASLQTGNIDFSFGIWVYLFDTSLEAGIVEKYSRFNASLREWSVYYNTGGFRAIWTGTTDTLVTASAAGTIQPRTWYFVVLRRSTDGTLSITVNGAKNTVTGATGGKTGSAPLVFGHRDGFTDRYFDGRLAAPVMAKRVWSDAELTWLYNAGLAARTYAELLSSGTGYELPDGIVGEPEADGYVSTRAYAATTAFSPLNSSSRNAMVSREVSGTTYQVIAYWNVNGKLAFGWRALPDENWLIYTTSITLSLADGHYFNTLGIDANGYLHISYDMHVHALKYRRSLQPIQSFDGTFTATRSMLGTNENAVSYPNFQHGPNNELYFTFRDGISGSANQYFYVYDPATDTWAALPGTSTGGLLIQGKTTESVYLMLRDGAVDPTGAMHIAWAWRNPVDDYNDVNYVRWTGSGFVKADGTPQTVPITPANAETVYTGSIQSAGVVVAPDASNRPHILYYRDVSGTTQAFDAYYNSTAWVDQQITSKSVDSLPLFDLAFDRATNTALALMADYSEFDGVKLVQSGTGNFTTWAESSVYAVKTGMYTPMIDHLLWRDQGLLHMPIFHYTSSPANYSVIVEDVTPA